MNISFTRERYTPEDFESKDHMSQMHWSRYKFTIPFVNEKKVMDIACGEGYGSNMLSKNSSEVVGIDIDSKSIEHAKNKYKKNNLNFYVGSVERIENQNELFDVVVSFETIEHVKLSLQKKFLSEVARILKPSGIFIVSTPDKDVGGEGHNEFHVHELNKPEFFKMLNEHFKEVEFYGQDIKPYGNKLSLFIARILHKLVKLDKLKIRHKLFPKKFRFALDTNVSNSAVNKNLVQNDIFTPKKIQQKETAAFLIAVCKK